MTAAISICLQVTVIMLIVAAISGPKAALVLLFIVVFALIVSVFR